jgi:hypothetical protein
VVTNETACVEFTYAASLCVTLHCDKELISIAETVYGAILAVSFGWVGIGLNFLYDSKKVE